VDEIYNGFLIATHAIWHVCRDCNANKARFIRRVGVKGKHGMVNLIIEVILWILKIILVLSLITLCINAFENKIVAIVVAIGILALFIMLFHAIGGDLKKEKIMENEQQERINFINTEVYKQSKDKN